MLVLAEILMWVLLAFILSSGCAAIIANAFFEFPEDRDDDVA